MTDVPVPASQPDPLNIPAIAADVASHSVRIQAIEAALSAAAAADPADVAAIKSQVANLEALVEHSFVRFFGSTALAEAKATITPSV